MKIMDSGNLVDELNAERVGHDMHDLISELYPICRSITGNGVRSTLNVIKQHIPINVYEIRTGTNVFDWIIPNEWNIKDAYIKNLRGERVIDFNKSNLHVVSYSAPIRRKVAVNELREHLFTLPEHADWIPYRTSYYKENWGFCVTHKQFLELTDAEYEVCVDSTLQPGHLTYGEYYLPGKNSDEVLVSCHTCHPSLCNDNLSGIALAVFLAKRLRPLSLAYSYRFLFIPGTIGSITWLCLNEPHVSLIKHGFTVACVGDSGNSTYKKSRHGDAEIDKAFLHVLKHSGQGYEIIDFSPYGYDERQFCSPGFNLAVGCFMRTPHARFAEYHTSADDLTFVRPSSLGDSLAKCLSVLDILESNRAYINQNPKCEPRLGKRGLYRAIGGQAEDPNELAMLWVLNLSDGDYKLLDIAERSGLSYRLIKKAAETLTKHGLLNEKSD